MGATSFITKGIGKTAKEAFQELVQMAEHEYGHSRDTGTIAEKDSYRMVTVPTGESPEDHIYNLLEDEDSFVSDKWGPAGCILVGTEVVVSKEKVLQQATQTKVQNIVQKGTRKWITYYVLYQSGEEVAKKEKKSEALQRGKDIALKTNVEVTIRIEKRLEGESSDVAIVTAIEPKPKYEKVKNEIHEYLFFGFANE